MSRRRNRSCLLAGFLLSLFVVIALLIAWIGVPYLAKGQFGEPTPALTGFSRFKFSYQVLIGKDDLKSSVNTTATETNFIIDSGESVTSVARRLERAGLINNAKAFRAYLIYKGLDSQIKAGKFQLSPALSSLQVTELIQSNFSPIVQFYIYPGWRAEEIAAALPTSGIEVDPDEFLQLIHQPELLKTSATYVDYPSLDGFLFPGVYEIDRNVSSSHLVQIFIDKFFDQVSPETIAAIENQGLSLYEGVVLASIIQRETFMDGERALMASVFYNRLYEGMKLETDPTVQYALGYSDEWGNWWKTPLRTNDLSVDSPYNTYNNYGLPPTPISNPDLPSILAVANPEVSPYFYFRAKCDGTGYHDFSITFEEHLGKECK